MWNYKHVFGIVTGIGLFLYILWVAKNSHYFDVVTLESAIVGLGMLFACILSLILCFKSLNLLFEEDKNGIVFKTINF